MSSTKLFNFKFLKENIKKSKGGIIISLIIVPLIISIYMVLSGINSSQPMFVIHSDIGIFNLIFMYLIPFLYSVYLFGFVFKKPSTDFINSMPINRKTMFITNTVGGIILITLIQFITAFLTLLWGGIFEKIIIFPMDVLEMFILSWTSYVFVFISANLAMTFSGTVQTQFVVTVLIIFLVPVCSAFIQIIKNDDSVFSIYSNDYYNLTITDGYKTAHFNTIKENADYTMPFKFMIDGWNFSWITIIKMLILSAIYYFIGFQLYQRRKMENNEESFGSVKLHIFVKTLTLIPILLLVNFADISEDITPFVVAIILSAVYYFVFDLIVRRKIAIKTTVLSFCIAVFIIQTSIMTMKSINNDNVVEIDSEDIKAISIGENDKTYRDTYINGGVLRRDNYIEDILDGNYYIKDNELLNLILEAKLEKENKSADNYYDDVNYNDYDYSNEELYFNIKLDSGKEYYTRMYISKTKYDKIINKLKENEDYKKHIEEYILDKDGIYEIGNDIVDSKTEMLIKKELKNSLDIFDTKNYLDNGIYYMTKNMYINHKLVSYQIPIQSSKDLVNIVAKCVNHNAVKNIRGYESGISISIYDEKDKIIDTNYNTNLLEFIEEHYDDEFDANKSYYIFGGSLYTRDGYKYFMFYTNKISEVKKLFKNSNTYNYIY